ncbi:hypothetical protein BROSI_A3006 [Candidatus Brocadia sinica JPN1]|uniref:Uncharacterized protein n=1 Tax=Candidatus Brocadia sinica JPN1 TaxID=1197129 RepID=A0ABQ0K129_9BACT|nr:hypothetical protein BROSI_A3006 [Candidatus Brocadia sinica JPN1]
MPRPYQIIIYNDKLIVIDKIVSDSIQVEQHGNNNGKGKLSNEKK